MAKAAKSWGVARANAQFSSLIERARTEGPQVITRSGRSAVSVVSSEEWERKTKRVGNLAEFFAASPLRSSGVRIRRNRVKARRVAL